MRIFPVYGQRLVDLQILARLHAAAAQNALIGIVAVERIAVVDLVWLLLKGVALVFHGEQFGGVVDRAVAVVVVAYRTVEFVIAEYAIERLGASSLRAPGLGGDRHPGRCNGGASANQFAIHLHDAGIAGLDGS